MKTYEAMFLMDPALASDWSVAEAEINRILQRADGKVLGLKKWDERRLAYPIGRHKRGLFSLCFFEAEPDRVAGLEHDVRLSEKVLRVLVLRRDKITSEGIEKALAAEAPSKVPPRGDEWNTRPPRRPAPERTGAPKGEPRKAAGAGSDSAPAAAPEPAPKSAPVSASEPAEEKPTVAVEVPASGAVSGDAPVGGES